MKKSKSMKVVSAALATSVLLSAQAWAVSAAPVVKPGKGTKLATTTSVASNRPAALAIRTESVNFNGVQVDMEVVEQSKGILVNARVYAAALGAKISYDSKTKTTTISRDNVSFAVKADDKFTSLNGVKRFITHAPRIAQKKLFIEIDQFTRILGGEVLVNEEGDKQYFAHQLIAGAVNPQWLDANHVIVSKQLEEGYNHYVVNVNTRKSSKLNISVVTDHLVPSPDSKHVAYTDENSNVYVYTFETNAEKKITEDTSEKLELQWASDNAALFYIDGPSSNAIAKVTLEGVITKLVDDKVNYKSDLYVMPNNTAFLYTVSKTSKVVTDTSGVKEGEDLPDFDVNIDPTGTEPQLFSFDSTVQGATPKALTTAFDDKAYSAMLSNGSVAYLSTVGEEEESVTNIKVINSKLELSTIILADVELFSLKVLNDKLYAFGYTSEDTQFLYEIDPVKGSAKKLAEAPLEVTNVMVGPSLNQVLAEDVDGKLYAWNNNNKAWSIITK
jgi:hypothetical protein